mmetsp:Transcript_53421/g.143120  ORF Transcript_53421/g.143120 Transcript_53421/m.143120 type:complete len:229 (-) Transcript_53421:303-989(-)
MCPKSLSCALTHSGTDVGSPPFDFFSSPPPLPLPESQFHQSQPLPPFCSINQDIMSPQSLPLSFPLPPSVFFPSLSLFLSSFPFFAPLPGTSFRSQSVIHTFPALALPSFPDTFVNSTEIPESKVVAPSPFCTVSAWKKISSPPSSGLMNPNLFSSRNFFTRPGVTSSVPPLPPLPPFPPPFFFLAGGSDSDSSSLLSAASFFLPLPLPLSLPLPLPPSPSSHSLWSS